MRGENKEKVIWCRMTGNDHEKFMAGYKNTIYRSVSEYARKLLLGIPPTVIYRNRSLDEFIEMAILLRRDLQTMLAMDGFIPAEKEHLKNKIMVLEELLIKISEKCSQV